ncbi:MAG: hypothetical protein LBH41_01290 [Rickettsiales bacterium]|jgi:UDP-N-acetylmuramoyl-tripeptide--D-alanyl-D-alanine ligase|nr:hypothetical protein [Rickettsiales bacterium]
MTALLMASFLAFAAARSLKSLQFFQQEGFSALDFVKFVTKGLRLVDKRLSSCVILYSLASAYGRSRLLACVALSAMFLIAAALHRNPLSKSRVKKRFRFTPRAAMIFSGAVAVEAFAAARIFLYLEGDPDYSLLHVSGWLVLLIQSIPFLMILSDWAFKPVEFAVKRYCYRKAYDKMTALSPVVIAVAGSFGKTSTKNILQHILSSLSTSVATPRSVNTLFGLVKSIMRDLLPSHKYFIVEMGSSSVGKIARMGRLVRHSHAILTAIGDMHYAYFKDRDSVAREKFSVFGQVKAHGGVMVVNSFQVAREYSDKYIGGYADALYLDERVLQNVRVGRDGVGFTLAGRDIRAPVYGRYQAYDIALAVAMAARLGFDIDAVVESLKTLPPTRHRQEVLRHPLGFTLLDDAYNSNPDGFESALETARVLAGENRVVLCTPGMLELGGKHREGHVRAARAAAAYADVVIAVLPERIADFTDEFQRAKKPGQLLVLAASFAAADRWLAANALSSDVVLFENDLSDSYEERIRI